MDATDVLAAVTKAPGAISTGGFFVSLLRQKCRRSEAPWGFTLTPR